MSRLSLSETELLAVLPKVDFSSSTEVGEVLNITSMRRKLDLSDLSAEQSAHLIATRAVDVLPSEVELAKSIDKAKKDKKPFVVKLGIDPTAADVHLGHAVPMLILSRFQRMGHTIVLILGDFTAKIGDPSGRSSDRPALSDDEINKNVTSYRTQVKPFFDFDTAEIKQNGIWLEEVKLPELFSLLSKIPVSTLLQREDFRNRLEAGHGLATSEFLYSIAQAIDSVRINASVELGGADQLLNLQMAREVMGLYGLDPQSIVTMPLIEGTDGTGAKMSKSNNNYISLQASPSDMFGKIMSIPDGLMVPYLKAWSEWTDSEIEILGTRLKDKSLHPRDMKLLLAGEVVAAIYEVPQALKAREEFLAQFSEQTLSSVASLPSIDLGKLGAQSITEILKTQLGFVESQSAARRLAKQNAIRLVFETDDSDESMILEQDQLSKSLREVLAQMTPVAGDQARAFLKVGRQVARLEQ